LGRTGYCQAKRFKTSALIRNKWAESNTSHIHLLSPIPIMQWVFDVD